MGATQHDLGELVGMAKNPSTQAIERAQTLTSDISNMANEAYANVPVPLPDSPYYRAGWDFDAYERQAASLATQISQALASGVIPLYSSDLQSEANAVDLLRVQFESDLAAGK